MDQPGLASVEADESAEMGDAGNRALDSLADESERGRTAAVCRGPVGRGSVAGDWVGLGSGQVFGRLRVGLARLRRQRLTGARN